MILILLLAFAWLADTNSHAASEHGTHAYEKKQYGDAARWYDRAQKLAPSPRGAFNLGTALIAAGERERGSAVLAEATKDPSLRADAFFNRGNSALAAKAFDHAINDYIETLKANPRHEGAKRNLEIALARREASQRESTGDKQNKPGAKEQQQQQQPNAGQKPPQGQPDLETLLRSVQQQEQEELRRMKAKVAAEGRVGW